MEKKTKNTKQQTKQQLLNVSYYNDDNIIEIGIDEVGRGPCLGEFIRQR